MCIRDSSQSPSSSQSHFSTADLPPPPFLSSSSSSSEDEDDTHTSLAPPDTTVDVETEEPSLMSAVSSDLGESEGDSTDFGLSTGGDSHSSASFSSTSPVHFDRIGGDYGTLIIHGNAIDANHSHIGNNRNHGDDNDDNDNNNYYNNNNPDNNNGNPDTDGRGTGSASTRRAAVEDDAPPGFSDDSDMMSGDGEA